MNTCSICKKHVEGSSTDIWNLVTLYQNDGEVHKTGEQSDVKTDYLVICDRKGCQQIVRTLWDRLVEQVIGGE